MAAKINTTSRPGVVILGGAANALSVARCLGRRGIKIYCCTQPEEKVRFSRYCKYIPFANTQSPEEELEDFLLSDEARHLHGSVLLACSDFSLEVLINRREDLSEHYVLDIMNVDAQRTMLNKKLSYNAASQAGVAFPRSWEFQNAREAYSLAGDVAYPIMIKPEYSHRFEERYSRKYLLANGKTELQRHLEFFEEYGGRGILLEFIPGPDSQLCSYYTYIDERGTPLFDFTKRIIRRYPRHEGLGCYHITDTIEEVKELSLKLFASVGLRGVANAEFKKDYRDGRLKFIECNARFTAANCLLEKSGIDLAGLVYDRLTGRPHTIPGSYRIGRRLWHPLNDFASFLQMRQAKQITLLEWVKSILHVQTFAFFAWHDPLPSAAAIVQRVRWNIKKFVKYLTRVFS